MSDGQIIETPGAPPSPLAEAWLSVSASLGDLTKSVTAAQQQRTRDQPIRGPLQRAGVVPASGPLVLDLGAPAMGRRWTLKNLAVSDGADVTAAAAGKAYIYVGQPKAFGPVGWRWQFTALPAAERFGSDQIDVVPVDHLLVVIVGGTAGQTILARAEVFDYPLSLPSPVVNV